MGASNGTNLGPLASGRRDIAWDGVPDADSAPNLLAPDFFNTTSPRGVVLIGGDGGLQVSADRATAARGQVRQHQHVLCFDSRRSRPSGCSARSDERHRSPLYVPGTSRPATVAGFGAVFTDVDLNNRSAIFAIGQFGQVLDGVYAPAADGDVSFAGVGFDAGERIASVHIVSGIERLGSDGAVSNKVVLDDFIYGEPSSRDCRSRTPARSPRATTAATPRPSRSRATSTRPRCSRCPTRRWATRRRGRGLHRKGRHDRLQQWRRVEDDRGLRPRRQVRRGRRGVPRRPARRRAGVAGGR